MEVQALSPEIIQDTTFPSTPTSTANTTISVTRIPTSEIDSTFSRNTINLLHPTLPHTRILHISDEFFAPASSLLHPHAPIHKPNTYTPQGAWYDGWETRRHNPSPPDTVVFRIGVPAGTVQGVEIDTGFFVRNHAEFVSVEGLFLDSGDEARDDSAVVEEGGWEPIMPPQRCEGGTRHAWLLSPTQHQSSNQPSNPPPPQKKYSHIRLKMHPDGGISRFRLHGAALPSFPPYSPTESLDLAALTSGGNAVSASDEHFGRASNLLLPGRGVDMGDGWETGRSRGRGVGVGDWVLIRLGKGMDAQGLGRVCVDTAFFKGNYPQSVAIAVAYDSPNSETHASSDHTDRREGENHPPHSAFTMILPPTPLSPDAEHIFTAGNELKTERLEKGRAVRWVKMTIFPDGGVKRLRVLGRRFVRENGGEEGV